MAWKHSVAALSPHLYIGRQADLGPCLRGVGTLYSSHLEGRRAHMHQAVGRMEGEAQDVGSSAAEEGPRGEETGLRSDSAYKV